MDKQAIVLRRNELERKKNSGKITDQENEELEKLEAIIKNNIAPDVETEEDIFAWIDILSTTGSVLQGYVIKEYIGIFSGEIAQGTSAITELGSSLVDLVGGKSGKLAGVMNMAREQAFNCMARRAKRNGANALVGVKTEMINIGNNIIGVLVTGTGVVVEKE